MGRSGKGSYKGSVRNLSASGKKLTLKDLEENVSSLSSYLTNPEIKKENENIAKNIIGMTIAVTTIITVGLTMNFLVAPNIPVPIPSVTFNNLTF